MKFKRIIACVLKPRMGLERAIRRGFFNSLPDSLYLKMVFPLRVGYCLNLTHPQTFNEKIQWLKLYDRRDEYHTYVDKYAVREYVKKTIGEQYLIPLLGVWDSVEEINFDELPDQFVLKTTHDSGGVIVCQNKREFDVDAAKKKLIQHLEIDFYFPGREWAYKGLERKIIAEQYMVDESQQELKDYKIFCFNGEPKFIQVDYGRFKNHKRNMYSIDWKYLDFTTEYPTDSEVNISPPANLQEMLRVARKLSVGLVHSRIDLYSAFGKTYFGEITLYHGCGFEHFYPKSYDRIIGDLLQLPGV